jgi:hypothetical protein
LEQKGFISKRAKCLEHTSIPNALINDAVLNKKQLLILSLNLRNPFGNFHMIELNSTWKSLEFWIKSEK